jgi:hypothetical protein
LLRSPEDPPTKQQFHLSTSPDVFWGDRHDMYTAGATLDGFCEKRSQSKKLQMTLNRSLKEDCLRETEDDIGYNT